MVSPEAIKQRAAALSLSLLRHLWVYRAQAAKVIRGIGHALGWLYDKFPLPQHVKDITTELTFQAIELFIVQSSAYQRWLTSRSGLSRLHGMLSDGVKNSAPPRPAEPSPSELAWQEILRDALSYISATPKLVVIIPVYNNRPHALRAIYSVLHARCTITARLVVVNDASADAELNAMLSQLETAGLIELIIHSRNQGYVSCVNEAMQHCAPQDVVLLNADMEVFDGWLDRLHNVLYSADNIASVTPFTNKPEHCAYPLPFHHVPISPRIHYAELDKMAATTNAAMRMDMPTAARCAMMIRRAALDQLGDFMEDPFARGYGEDQDWCLRAAQSPSKWRHLLAADCFVAYHGEVTQEPFKARRLKRAYRRLSARHPHYQQLISSYHKEDPLRPYRMRLDLAQLASLKTERCMLMISHNAGGGTEAHIQEMSASLTDEGITVYRLSPDPRSTDRLRLWHDEIPLCPNLFFNIDFEQEALMDTLAALSIHFVHIHHLIGFPQRFIELFLLMQRQLQFRYDVTIHDYYFACPSINLLVNGPIFTGNPALAESQRWADEHPAPSGRMPIWQWRLRHQALLAGAHRLITPSDDCAQRMQYFYPSLHFTAQPHPDSYRPLPAPPRNRQTGDALHVAIIGHLAKHKGSAIVEAMALDAKQRNLPLHFHLFGEASDKAFSKNRHVTCHGAYDPAHIVAQLAASPCQIAWFASIWPETYSYTLSTAYNARLYPIAFDLGAIAERIHKSGWGSLVPLSFGQNPSAINDLLLQCDILAMDEARINAAFHHYSSISGEYYQGALALPAPGESSEAVYSSS